MHDATVIPAAAIQRGPQGTFVYLVKTDKTVTLRPVTIGVTQGDEVSITAGLEPGESVVVDGAERLRDGSKVEVKEPGGGRRSLGGGPNPTGQTSRTSQTK